MKYLKMISANETDINFEESKSLKLVIVTNKENLENCIKNLKLIISNVYVFKKKIITTKFSRCLVLSLGNF
jgi:hypothetical protein